MIAIVAITPGGSKLARRLASQLAGSAIYVPERFASPGDRTFSEPLAKVLPELFRLSRGLICIMATGIVVRLLAPHLQGKASDPAVVVADEAGHFAISLLSGHLGGANELARRVAAACGGEAVITTATDVNELPAWDDIARCTGLALEPLANIKTLNRLLLEGRRIALVDRQRRVADHFLGIPGVEQVETFAAALHNGYAGRVFVTHRYFPGMESHGDLLILRPRDLIVGIGCNRGTSAEEIEAAIRHELEAAFLSPLSIAGLATIEEKSDEEGLVHLARKLGLHLEFHSAEDLNAATAPSPASEYALQAVGARGVCEPAALLSSGSSTLLVKKKKRGNVTVAVAEKRA